MAEPIYIVQNDTYPNIDLTVIDRRTQEPVSVSGATVKLYLRPEGGTTLTTITGTLPNGGTDGQCRFAIPISPNPFATAGNFEAELEVTFSNGKIQTAYEKMLIVVRSQIG